MARKRIIHDIDSENDPIIAELIKTGTPLNLENYMAFMDMGGPPEGFEEDGDFLADLPEVILKSIAGRHGEAKVLNFRNHRKSNLGHSLLLFDRLDTNPYLHKPSA